MNKGYSVKMKARYADGYKYCSRCRVYIKTDKTRCPYCGVLLRSSPRKKKYQKKRAIATEVAAAPPIPR